MTGIDDIAVLTSENVRLTYTLSGMGKRTLAFIVDSIIIFLLVYIFTALLFASIQQIGEIAIALYLVATTVILYGYYFFFEWINWGQTPGKQLFGIRVAMADGAPVDIVACAVRNVIRIVDMLLLSIGITFFIMIFTPRYQRLGDLAAGTVVVKRRRLSFDHVINAARESERAQEFIHTERVDTSVRIRINDSEHDLLMKFIERRESLPEHVRAKLASDLAGRLRSRSPGGVMDELNDEQLIETTIAEYSRMKVR